MKVNEKTVFNKGKEVHYTHIENGSTVVCFMLSGAGYTYDKPLFYYSTMVMLENQYDVVHIHYSYGKDIFHLPLENITEVLVGDITPIIDDVLKNHRYKKLVFLGKSLGTIPIINGFMKSNMFMDSKMILLTPLLGLDSIFETLLMTDYPSLIVIGEEDEHYIPIKIESIDNKANIMIEKIPDANQSLDIEPFNTSMSITALDKVMKKVDAFLK